MRWNPRLGQWSSIEEPPEWRSVIVPEGRGAATAVAPAPRKRPSMFDAFRPSAEDPRVEPGPRPSMFRAFGPAPEPERRAPAPRPEHEEAPRPSMFSAFRPEEGSSVNIWTEMFGEPVGPRAASTPPQGLVFKPSMSGAGPDSGKGFSWGLAGVVAGLGALFLLEASGVTNLFGTRRTP